MRRYCCIHKQAYNVLYNQRTIFTENDQLFFFTNCLSLSMLRIWTYDIDLVCFPDVISALNNLCGKRPSHIVVTKVLQFIKRVWGMSTYFRAIRGTNFRRPSTMSMLAAGLHEDLPQGFIGWDQQSMQWPRWYKYDRFPQKLFEYNDRWQDLPTVYFAGDNTVSVFFGLHGRGFGPAILMHFPSLAEAVTDLWAGNCALALPPLSHRKKHHMVDLLRIRPPSAHAPLPFEPIGLVDRT